MAYQPVLLCLKKHKKLKLKNNSNIKILNTYITRILIITPSSLSLKFKGLLNFIIFDATNRCSAWNSSADTGLRGPCAALAAALVSLGYINKQILNKLNLFLIK